MKARLAGECGVCCRAIKPGQQIRRWGGPWVHSGCRDAALASTLTRHGLTFASGRQSSWKMR